MFLQLIDIPTRITLNCLSLIDLIFVNQPDDVICHGTLPKIADHDGIIVSFHCTQEKIPVRTRVIYDYTNVDEEGLVNHIKILTLSSEGFK